MLIRSSKNWVVDFFVSRGWLVKRRRLRRRPSSWNPLSTVPAECLEVRTLLSTITVTSLADTLNAGAAHGVTLRDAIQAANTHASVDGSVAGEANTKNVIVFTPNLTGTISLTHGEMTISSSIEIDGLGSTNTIIDAQDNSRIFRITGTAGDVTLDGLTLENGQTADFGGSGGAIQSVSDGILTILNSTLTGNSTLGQDATGGAIYNASGLTTITNSTLSGNFTAGEGASGGAIASISGAVKVTNSTLSENLTEKADGSGGAIYSGSGAVTVSNSLLSQNCTLGVSGRGGAICSRSGAVTVTNSTISRNFTENFLGNGGAIFSQSGAVTVTNSTLSGNSTIGLLASGGAISCYSGTATVTNSTLYGNYTEGPLANGGALYSSLGAVVVTNSTIAGNHADDAKGGGISAGSSATTIALRNSILAQNTDAGTSPDLSSAGGTFSVTRSLIGDNTGSGLAAAPVGSPDSNGNLIGTSATKIDPLLGALAFNGGPTPTLALLAGSPAINSGNNALAIDPGPDGIPGTGDDSLLVTDQRGIDFARFAGTVDMGAYEIQTLATPTVSPIIANHNVPVLTGTYDPLNAMLLQVKVNGTTFQLGTGSQLTSDGSGHWTLTTPAAIPDGTYDVVVHTSDLSGDVASDTTTNELVIDTVAPATPTVNALLINSNTPVLTGTWDQGSAGGAVLLQVTVNDTTFTLGTSSQLASDGLGHWTLTTTATIADGMYTVQVHTADSAGNVADDVAPSALVIDTVPPGTTMFAGEYAVVTFGSNVVTLATITQNGLQLTLQGSTAAQVASTTQLQIGGTTSTYGDGVINFASTGPFANQVWTKLDLPPHFTNQSGATVHVIQNGASLTFVDKFGGTSPGIWTSPTQLFATAWNETVTTAVGKLLWQDGSIWSESLVLKGARSGVGTTTITATPSQISVFDYVNQSGKGVHLIQTGTTNVLFIDGMSHMSIGTFISPTQLTTPYFPGDIATISNDMATVTWTDGSVWTATAPTAAVTVTHFTNQNGVPVHLIQNGTSQIGFVDGLGRTSLGTMLSPTTVQADLYPGDVAHFSGNTVTWDDGFIWTQTNIVPLMITLTDTNNSVFHVQLTGRTTLIGLDGAMKGLTATRLNGKLFWSNGIVWDNFDIGSLNAFFEMGTGYP